MPAVHPGLPGSSYPFAGLCGAAVALTDQTPRMLEGPAPAVAIALLLIALALDS